MHIQFGSLCWDCSVYQGILNVTNDKQTFKTGCVCFFVCLKALFSATNGGFLQPLPPSSLTSPALLWFSCHYLLIKVENNSPGPDHLFNDKPHPSVCLPAGSWFSHSGHHASAHRISSFHLTMALINARSEGKPLHLLPVHVWVCLRGFLLRFL